MAKPNLGRLLAARSRPAKIGPARTRFAPSPTGTIHLGSLRTALYNYLLAKSTGGTFVLRLEDTDQQRLKPGAEQYILDSLEWAQLKWDECPIKQSERRKHYGEHIEKLLESGHAYRCFCSKERLDKLAESARALNSTASYDRKCTHISPEESEARARTDPFVVRFWAPERWPSFQDALHGTVDSQSQTNPRDVRFDDFVLVKSDGMPTYHFANVVDDSLMQITHVVRGEEWMPSTPKHVALYAAFGLEPPQFVHIPLLTGEGGKKLSKRKSSIGVLELAEAPQFIGPEALVNFAALLGWSPATTREQGETVSEVLSLKELENRFSLSGLTRGNIQVDFSKLQFFNKQHFELLVQTNWEEAVRRCQVAYPKLSMEETDVALKILKTHVSCVSDYVSHMTTVTAKPGYSGPVPVQTEAVVNAAKQLIDPWNPSELVKQLKEQFKAKDANMALRYVLLDGKPGTSIVEALELLGRNRTVERLNVISERF